MNTYTAPASSTHFGLASFLRRWVVLAAFVALSLLVQHVLFGVGTLTVPRLERYALLALGLGLVGSLWPLLARLRRSSGSGAAHSPERALLDEAQRLRVTRERARAIYEMATTLSATLDHRRVLEEAQNIGTLSLREDLGPEVRLVSAVLLFQGDDNKLRVITSRGLTPSDKTVALSGRRGVLGLAMKRAQPIFGGAAVHDPELRYFAGFHRAQSVLAIPLSAGFDVYGVMIFGCDEPNAFSDDHVELMTAIGTQSALSLQNAVLYQTLLSEKEKIVEVEEDARKKLARDLHDGPTQSVAAIAMRVNYIRRLLERQPEQAREELWKVEELARRTTKEIRHMLFTLRPLVLETQGLIAALHQLAEKMRDTHDIHVEVQGQPEVEEALDTNAQGVLFYIIEEAVNNARKHAQSETIWVRLYLRNEFVVTEIEDDGVGFDVQAVDEGYDQRGSLGMINMRERAELIEGQLHIQSAPGKGTKITVLVRAQRSGVVGAQESSAPPLQLQSQRTRPIAPQAQVAPTRSPTQPARPAPHAQRLRSESSKEESARRSPPSRRPPHTRSEPPSPSPRSPEE